MVDSPKITVFLAQPLLDRARAAVAHLAPEGLTLSRLVRDALERELARLEKRHGPFPPAKRPLRRGRPKLG